MREKLKRYVIFLLGLFVNSFGVSLITKAALGTSPISSIPYVLSLNFPYSLGQFTIYFSLLLIFLQLLILRKEFKLEHVLQIPVSIAFGWFIDICMALLFFVQPEQYVQKILYLLVGCLILGVGVYMEMLANVVMLPGESFVRAVVFRWNTEFGLTKVCFDVSMTVIAAVLSFVFAGKLLGVREGTIVAAVLVGFIARLIGRKLSFLPEKLFGVAKEEETESQEAEAQPSFAIVIDRQYGSGGHEIGERLAEKLSYAFYDREIIQTAAGSTGYTPEFITRREERMTNSLLYDLVTQMYAYSEEKSAPDDAIFKAESEVIRQAVDQGDCVIVGRCADRILKDHPCLKIFLSAPMDFRIKRIMERENVGEQEAKKMIQQNDRRRSEYYRYYTGKIWGMASNYHLCVDTSTGYENALAMIESILKASGR